MVLILALQEVGMLRKIEIQIWATKYFLRPYLEKNPSHKRTAASLKL
jgi:hypothetical protein